MIHDILTILWIFLPLGVANTSPVLANNIPVLKRFTQPLDFNKTYRSKRIFGDHKTIRGLLAGMLVGGIVACIQFLIAHEFDWSNDYSAGLDYTSPIVIFMGIALGFGALAGDAIKSFFKRQINVPPGESWIPFDQIDFLLGGLLASLPFVILPIGYYITGILIGLVLHPTINFIAWVLHLQDKPY